MEDFNEVKGVDDLFQSDETPEIPEVSPVDYLAEEDQIKTGDHQSMDSPRIEDEPKEIEDSKAGRIAAERGAKTLTNALNFATSAGCSAISDRPRKEYKMDEDEKEEIMESLADWLEILGKEFSPAIAFVVALIVIVGGKLWTAREDYKEDQKEKEFQAKKKRIQEERRKEARLFVDRDQSEQTNTETATKFDDSIKTTKRTIRRTKRKRYTIDADGFYERHEVTGKYLPKEERDQKPTAGELAIIEEVMMRDDYTEKLLNRELKAYNKI